MLPIFIRVLDISDHRLLAEFEWQQVPPVGAFLHLKNLSGTTAYQVKKRFGRKNLPPAAIPESNTTPSSCGFP